MQTDRSRVLLSLRVLARNGVATHLKVLSRGLRERGWDVAIAVEEIADTPVDERFMTAHGIECFNVPFPDFVRSSKSPMQAIKAMIALNRVVRAYRPDVIHTLGLGITPFVYPIRLLYGVPLVSSCRNEPLPRVEAFAKQYAPLVRLLNPIFGDRVVAISKKMCNVIEDVWKVPPSRIRLVPNGVNDSYFRPPSAAEREEARQALDLPPDRPAVCLVGRLSWVKGQHIFVRAIAHLVKQGSPVIGLCAGEGPLKDKIRELAAELGVTDHVRLLGHTDARQVYWASDACVLPSEREAFANVMAEAMLCGTVPVRTPAAGADEQIQEGVTGFLIPFDDPEALADRIATLLDDETQRRAMSERARAVALEKFTASAMVERTIDVYNELIPEDASPTPPDSGPLPSREEAPGINRSRPAAAR